MDNGYNQFTSLPNLPMNIARYLVQENEIIWKLLKYSSASCLSETNLTEFEKLQLIYNGNEDTTQYRVFFDNFSDDNITDEQICMLRLYPVGLVPDNHVLSSVTINFEVICHSKINLLDNYQPRSLLLMQQVLETLNGKDISGGLGLIQFNKGTKAQYNLFNGRNFKGYSFQMITKVN